MADVYVHNNPRDLAEEIFEQLEEQVFNISRNMNLLEVALEIKLGQLRDDGGSNLENKLEDKSED
jgi:hypothetical protein